jgi:phosphotriesterase-related protein
MTTINTVCGALDSAEIGRTLIHEHVMVGFPGWFLDPRRPRFQRDEALGRVVDAFQQLHDYGVRTVVDPCPMDMGRNVEFCAEVSQRSGINLICSTGLYTEEMGAAYVFKKMSVEEITEIYVREIEDGIGASGIRAGLVKIATGDGFVSDFERRVLTAAGRAARITGVPVLSHTEKCSCGHDQIDIITGEGVEAHRLLIGHSDGRDDPEYQQSLAERGVYVGFDRFGLERIISDEVRMCNLKSLVDAGHRDRVMVSHDTVECLLGGLPGNIHVNDLHAVNPSSRMTHLFENIFPRLRQMGMSEGDLDHIVQVNPRRFFEHAAP